MSSAEKVSVALPPELLRLVKKAVRDGGYASDGEVIGEALRDWRDKQHRKEVAVQELKRLWREGVASGPGRYKSMDEIKAAARG